MNTATASVGATPRRIAIAGASGRMGRMLIEAVLAADDCVLAGAFDRPGSATIGQDATAFLGHESGVRVTDDLHAGLANAQVLIDFTRPEGTLEHLRSAKNGKIELDEDSRRRMLLCVRILSDPAAFEALHGVLIRDCRASYQAVLEGIKAQTAADLAKVASDEPATLQADDLISFRQLRGKKALGSTDIDIDDGADIGRAVATNEYSGKLRAVHQLTGFADSVYAEAYVTVHDYDIVLEILVINRTPTTLNNLSVDLTPMGDLKLIERPASVTIGPLDTRTIRANIKVSSTETGHIFGTIVYESASGADKTYVNLNDIHLDIMDYIVPASCADTAFRSMWAEFEWENKVAVNTDITNVFAFLQHITDKTNMRCMTPTASLGGDTNFLAANLYAKSIFGTSPLTHSWRWAKTGCFRRRRAGQPQR